MAKRTKNFAADRDFTEEMLPNNRKTQFFMIIRNRIPLLFKASIVTFVFFIPILIAMSFRVSVNNSFYRRFQTGDISYEVFQNYILYTDFWSVLIYVPCLAVASLGLSGLNRLTHQLVFGEGIIFKDDFFLGIKNNWKQYLLYTFFLSMAFVFGRWVRLYFQDTIFSFVLFFVICAVAVPYYLVLLLYSNVYTSRGGELLKNVFMATLSGKLKLLFYIAVVVVPVILLEFLTGGYLFLILFALYLLALPILALLGNMLYAGIFDELFNYLNNVEIVKKGLYIDEKEKEMIKSTHTGLLKQLQQKGDRFN